jgi:hypothetical protein
VSDRRLSGIRVVCGCACGSGPEATRPRTHPGPCRCTPHHQTHPGGTKRVRTPDVRATPGHVQAACDTCHNSVNDYTPRIQSELLSPPSSAPRVLLGCTLCPQAPPDASVLCAPRMGRGGIWSWTTGGGFCLRVPALHGTRVAPRETRYAHAGDGKVLPSLFPKEKLRSLRMSALTNESMPPHKVLVFDTETSGLIPRDNGKFRRTLRNWINAHHEKGFAIFPTIRKSPNRTNAGSSSTTAAFSRLSNVASFKGQAQ